MSRDQAAKKPYHAPCIEVLSVKMDNPLLVTSPVSGGHHDAEDDEGLSAKRGRIFYDDDSSWSKGDNLWDED